QAHAGVNSYWRNNYAQGPAGFWKYPDPAAPTRGQPCNLGPGSPNGYQGCTGSIPYHPTNLWNGNNFNPMIYVHRAVDTTQEVATLSDPGLPPGRGRQFMGFRVRNPGPILGEKFWPAAPVTTIGQTQAFGVSSNMANTTVLNYAWKGNEFGAGGLWMFGYQQNAPDDSFPFSGFMFYAQGVGVTQATCNANKGTDVVGHSECNLDTAIYFWATSPTYSRARDWPDGTWGCVRGHISGMGTANMRIQEWFQHVGDSSETLVLDIQNINASFLKDKSYSNFMFDTYSNYGSNVGPLPEAVYRYEDNLHLRNGSPGSCGAIGFDGSVQPPPPPPPPLSGAPAAPILLAPAGRA